MKTPITYYGGKQTMLKYIRPHIPAHKCYCEPFAGGAAVFFDKEPVQVNVINDLNGELVNFYRVVVSDPESLRKEVIQTLHCRVQHQQAWHIYNHPVFFTPVQRAWAVWILSKLSFAGQIPASFGFDKSEGRHPKKLNNAKMVFCDELVTLLEKATIECDNAFKVIRRYDAADTFHFLDPPYVGSDMGHYSGMFNNQNLLELLELCSTLKGKFMLTMYPNDIIKDFADRYGWKIHAVDRQISACSVEYRRKQTEWMVCNY